MGRHVSVNVVYFVTCFPARIAVIYAWMLRVWFSLHLHMQKSSRHRSVAWRILPYTHKHAAPYISNINARHPEPESKARVYTFFSRSLNRSIHHECVDPERKGGGCTAASATEARPKVWSANIYSNISTPRHPFLNFCTTPLTLVCNHHHNNNNNNK